MYNGPPNDDPLSICAPLVHYFCALFFAFIHYCILFMHNIFSCWFMLHYFMAHFVLHLFRFWIYTCCNFSYGRLFKLQFFCVLPCSWFTFLCVALFSCCTFSCVASCWTDFIFLFCIALLSCYSFYLAASCCTLFMLHFLGIQVSIFINNGLHHWCFFVEIVKLSRTPILENISERLFQNILSRILIMPKSHNIVILQRMNGLILLRSEAVVQRCSVKKCVLRNFAKVTGKHMCQSLLLQSTSGGCSYQIIF